jgi:hypothetical protein
MTLPLAAGQIISVNDTTSTALYWTMFGCEIAAGVPQYKVLATGGPVTTAGSWQNIYQVPTGRTAFMSHMVLWTNGAQQTVYVGSGGGGYLANAIYLPANGWASWDTDGGWHYYDQYSTQYP